MHWRTTAILLLATLGIGTYISLHDLKAPTRAERESLTKQVISLPPESVTQLTLQVPTGKIVVERTDGGWRLIPQGVRADESRVTGLLEQTSPLAAQRVLSGSPKKPLDYAAYGLAPEAGSLTLTAKGRATTVLFGDKTPVGTLRYAKRADRPEVYVVPAALFDESDVPLEQFRDPALIPIKSWTAESLTVASQRASFSLRRQGENWELTQPIEDRAERGGVTTLLNRVGSLRISRFVDDAPPVERLSEWGFDRPMAELTVTGADAPKPIRVFFGKPLAEAAEMVYAKRSDEPALYAVAASDVEALLVDSHGLRSKACFEFFTGQVTKIALENGRTRWSAVKQAERWKAEGTNAELETKRVEDFLNTAADLRLGGFVEDAPADLVRYGLAPPQGTIAIWTAGAAAPQRLLIGEAIEKTTNRYGRIEGRAAVVRLPDVATELLKITADSLRSEPSAPVPPTVSAASPKAGKETASPPHATR